MSWMHNKLDSTRGGRRVAEFKIWFWALCYEYLLSLFSKLSIFSMLRELRPLLHDRATCTVAGLRYTSVPEIVLDEFNCRQRVVLAERSASPPTAC